MRLFICLFLFGALLLVSVPTWADPVPITTLFNTGVANDGTLLTDNSLDPHYSLIDSPDPAYPGPNLWVNRVGFYTPDTPTSRWIRPNLSTPFPTMGDYTYRATFYLPESFNPKKDLASINGMWSSDNTGLDILINGLSTGYYIPYGSGTSSDPYSWAYLSSFSIVDGFQEGLNTLDFVIFQDGDSPTGIQVQMTGTYDLKPIPEPSTLSLLGIGIIGIACGLKRLRL